MNQPGLHRLAPRWWPLLLLSVVWVTSGANCIWQRPLSNPFTPALDPVLSETATLSEVMGVVNQQAGQLHTLSTTTASISGRAGGYPVPRLAANIAVQRPLRFRLVGETGVFGSREVDLGSNEELFWFWVRRNEPPNIYYARHQDYHRSNLRKVWPVDPQMLIDAFGMATLDPQAEHFGPYPVGRNRLEIRSVVSDAGGTHQRVTRVDRTRGWVVEQHYYDAGGQLMGSVLASGHRADPATGIVVPRKLEMQWPPANLSLTVDLGDVKVNVLEGDPQSLWTMPTIEGYTPVRFTDMQPRFGSAPAPLAAPVAATSGRWRFRDLFPWLAPSAPAESTMPEAPRWNPQIVEQPGQPRY